MNDERGQKGQRKGRGGGKTEKTYKSNPKAVGGREGKKATQLLKTNGCTGLGRGTEDQPR